MTKAPELQVSQWFNTDQDLKLNDLRGKVVVIEAFQMLCPGCILEGIPLAKLIHATFPSDKLAMIGLHTVFEHHDAMTPVSLRAFLHEFNVTFPVAVDKAGSKNIPLTMEAYGMRGTPSLILIDAEGQLCAQYFGSISEIKIGAEIATLLK